MTEYFKHPNPYREGTDAYDLFSHMQKIQSYTIRGLIDYCIVKLHLSPTEASQKVYIMNSPREKSRNGNDCRGNYASHGHLYFSEKLARQYIAGVKQPQFYRLRWRKNPLPPKKRIANKVKRFKRIKEVINELAE